MSDSRLQITLASRLESGFGSSFTQAADKVKGLRDEIVDLKKQQSLIKKFDMDTVALETARSRINALNSTVNQLHRSFGERIDGSAVAHVKSLNIELKELKAQEKLLKKFDIDMSAMVKARTELSNTTQKIRELDLKIKQDRKLGIDTTQSEKAIAALATASSKLTDKLQKKKAAVIDSKQALTEAGLSASKTAAQLNDLATKINTVVDRSKRIGASATEYDKAQARVEKLANSMERLRANAKTSGDALASSGIDAKKTASEYDALGTRITSLDLKYQKLKTLAASGTGLSTGFNDLKASAISAGIAIASVIYSINTLTKKSEELEGLNAAYKAIFNTSENGAEQLSFVREQAESLGLNFISLAQSYKSWAAAAEETNMKGQLQREIFTSVASASKVLKLSTENTKGALKAMEQMMSKGTVSSEELRQQLGEHMPGAFNMAAKAMGVTTKELSDMLQKGEVMADELLPRLANELNKKYGEGLSDAQQSLSADTERMKNRVHELSAALGKTLAPMAQRTTQSMIGMLDGTKGLVAEYPQLVVAAAKVATGVAMLAGGVVLAKVAMLGFKASSIAVQGALVTLNPVLSLTGQGFSKLASSAAAGRMAALIAPIGSLATGLVGVAASSSIASAGLALMTGPIGWIVGGIAIAGTALYAFRDNMVEIGGVSGTVGEFVAGTWNVVGDRIAEATGISYTSMKRTVMGYYDSVSGFAHANLTKMKLKLNELYRRVADAEAWEKMSGFIGAVVTSGKNYINRFIGLWVGAFNTIKIVWNNFPAALEGAVVGAANAAISKLSGFVQGAAKLLNKILPEDMEIDISGIQIPLLEASASAQETSAAISEAFRAAGETDYLGEAGEAVSTLADRAKTEFGKVASAASDVAGVITDHFGELRDDIAMEVALQQASDSFNGLGDDVEIVGGKVGSANDQMGEFRAKADELAGSMSNPTGSMIEELSKLPPALGKSKDATKALKDEQTDAEKQRKKAVAGLKKLRGELELSKIARTQGTDAMKLQKYELEGLTAEEVKEQLSLEKSIAKNNELMQKREAAVKGLEDLRSELELSKIARDQGTDAMKLQKYELGGLTEEEAKEQLSLEKSIAKNNELTQKREAAVKGLENLRGELELSKVARTKSTDAMKLQQYELEGLTAAEARERLSLEQTKAANEALTEKREQAVESLKTLRTEVELSTVARSSGTEVMKLQQYELEGLTAAEAKERLSLEQTKAANEALTEKREQAIEGLKQLKAEVELSTVARNSGTESMKLQQYELEGLTAAEAKERLSLEQTKEANEKVTEQRKAANDSINEARTSLEKQTISLVKGSEAARRFELQTAGYSTAQQDAMLSIENTSAALDRQGEVINSIEGALTEAAMNGFNSFSELGENIKDIFKDMVLEPVVSAVMAPVSSAMGNSMSGLGNTLSESLGMGSMFGETSGGGVMSLLQGGGATAALGAAGLGASVGQMFGQTGIGSGLGAAIGNFILPGIGGFVGAALGGIVESAFGGKTRQTGAGIELSYNASEGGLAGQNYETFSKKKSLWRGTKRWTEYSDLDASTETAVSDYFDNMTSSITAQLEKIGAINAESALDGLVIDAQKFSGENAEADMQAWLENSTVKAYQEAYKTLPSRVKGAISSGVDVFTSSLEDISARFEMVSIVANNVIPVIDALGLQVGSATTELTNSVKLMDELGGLEAGTAKLQFYAENFSDATALAEASLEISRDSIEEWNTSIGRTGTAVIDTKDAFTEYIQSLDLTTDAGREASAAAMDQMNALLEVASANEVTKLSLVSMIEASHLLNLQFDATSPLATKAAESIVQLMGGLEQFNEATSKYYNEFYSEAEREAIVLANAASSVAAFNNELGLMGEKTIDTAAEFRGYVESLDLNTEQGQIAYTEAMNLVEAMSTINEYEGSLEDAISSIPTDMLISVENMQTANEQAEKSIDAAKNGLDSAVEAASSGLNNLWTSISKFTNSLISKAESLITGDDSDGSHFTGAFNIPHDGYRATLHKGEMVIPAAQAERVREGGTLTRSETRNNVVAFDAAKSAHKATGSGTENNQRVAALLVAGALATAPLAAAAGTPSSNAVAPVTVQAPITIYASEGMSEEAIAELVQQKLLALQQEMAAEQRGMAYDQGG